DTNDLTDGNVTFVVNVELKSAGSVGAGLATLQIFPATTSRVVEFAAADSAAITNDAFYASGFTSLTAGLVIIGRLATDEGTNQTGDIHVGNDLAMLTFNQNLKAENSAAGKVFLESDCDSSAANGNLTFISGSGVTLRD